MNNLNKFGTTLNCIDGRVQNPVAEWVKFHSHVQYVDTITTPGIVNVLTEGDVDELNSIYGKLQLSVKYHQSQVVAVAGHFDCAVNNVTFETQKEQITESADLINSWNLGVRVVGLFVNEWMSVDVICDTEEHFKPMRSFL